MKKVFVMGAVVAWAFPSMPALATPRFSARQGAPCVVCHVNPAGGGMRTAFGRGVYERQALPASWLGSHTGWRLNPRLGDNVALGADLRTAYLRTDLAEGPPALDSFYVMQADLYVAADLGPHATLYLDRGAWGSFEAFALLHYGLRDARAGWYGYAKVGRFVPAYGLRLETHATLTREGLDLGPTFRDTGLELGLYHGPFSLQASFVQGALTDDNEHGAFYGRVEWLRRRGRFNLVLGASASHRPEASKANRAVAVKLDESQGVREWRAGVHGALSVGRLTWLGELHQVQVQSRVDDRKGRALASYQELDFIPTRGVDVQLTHEWSDPDFELRSGAFQRVGAGIELYPAEYVELRLMARMMFAPAHSPLDGARDILGFLHLFF